MKKYYYVMAAFAAFFVSCAPAFADLANVVAELQDDSTLIDAVNVLIQSAGAYDWALWALLGLVAVHLLALVYVNFTDTPDDNTNYGKLYKKVLEPLAGLLVGFKAKQRPFNGEPKTGSNKSTLEDRF